MPPVDPGIEIIEVPRPTPTARIDAFSAAIRDRVARAGPSVGRGGNMVVIERILAAAVD